MSKIGKTVQKLSLKSLEEILFSPDDRVCDLEGDGMIVM